MTIFWGCEKITALKNKTTGIIITPVSSKNIDTTEKIQKRFGTRCGVVAS